MNKTMTNSLMQWHLARDNRIALHKFCAKHQVRQETQKPYEVEGLGKYFRKVYHFNNGGFIEVELRAGDKRSYTIADHFQVVDYGWATDLTHALGEGI